MSKQKAAERAAGAESEREKKKRDEEERLSAAEWSTSHYSNFYNMNVYCDCRADRNR